MKIDLTTTEPVIEGDLIKLVPDETQAKISKVQNVVENSIEWLKQPNLAGDKGYGRNYRLIDLHLNHNTNKLYLLGYMQNNGITLDNQTLSTHALIPYDYVDISETGTEIDFREDILINIGFDFTYFQNVYNTITIKGQFDSTQNDREGQLGTFTFGDPVLPDFFDIFVPWSTFIDFRSGGYFPYNVRPYPIPCAPTLPQLSSFPGDIRHPITKPLTIAVFNPQIPFLVRENTAIYYQTLGEKPNRILIIQWNNLDVIQYFGDPNSKTVNFQAKLFESTGKIEIHIKDYSNPVLVDETQNFVENVDQFYNNPTNNGPLWQNTNAIASYSNLAEQHIGDQFMENTLNTNNRNNPPVLGDQTAIDVLSIASMGSFIGIVNLDEINEEGEPEVEKIFKLANLTEGPIDPKLYQPITMKTDNQNNIYVVIQLAKISELLLEDLPPERITHQIIKLDSNCNLIWIRNIGRGINSFEGRIQITDLLLDIESNSDSIYISGNFSQDLLIANTTDMTDLFDTLSTTGIESFVLKMDIDGNWLWAIKGGNRLSSVISFRDTYNVTKADSIGASAITCDSTKLYLSGNMQPNIADSFGYGVEQLNDINLFELDNPNYYLSNRAIVNQNLPIGFEFNYAGTNYNEFNLFRDGFISFGDYDVNNSIFNRLRNWDVYSYVPNYLPNKTDRVGYLWPENMIAANIGEYIFPQQNLIPTVISDDYLDISQTGTKINIFPIVLSKSETIVFNENDFQFEFFNEQVSSMYISSFGRLVFDTDIVIKEFTNSQLKAISYLVGQPFKYTQNDLPCQIYYQFVDDSNGKYLVVQWTNIALKQNFLGSEISFQFKLYASNYTGKENQIELHLENFILGAAFTNVILTNQQNILNLDISSGLNKSYNLVEYENPPIVENIFYQTVGETPNRILIVEWFFNLSRRFQIQLFEQTNVIEIHISPTFGRFTGIQHSNGNSNGNSNENSNIDGFMIINDPLFSRDISTSFRINPNQPTAIKPVYGNLEIDTTSFNVGKLFGIGFIAAIDKETGEWLWVKPSTSDSPTRYLDLVVNQNENQNTNICLACYNFDSNKLSDFPKDLVLYNKLDLIGNSTDPTDVSRTPSLVSEPLNSTLFENGVLNILEFNDQGELIKTLDLFESSTIQSNPYLNLNLNCPLDLRLKENNLFFSGLINKDFATKKELNSNIVLDTYPSEPYETEINGTITNLTFPSYFSENEYFESSIDLFRFYLDNSTIEYDFEDITTDDPIFIFPNGFFTEPVKIELPFNINLFDDNVSEIYIPPSHSLITTDPNQVFSEGDNTLNFGVNYNLPTPFYQKSFLSPLYMTTNMIFNDLVFQSDQNVFIPNEYDDIFLTGIPIEFINANENLFYSDIIDLGDLNISFYGNQYNQIRVNQLGFISFDLTIPTELSTSPTPFPSAKPPFLSATACYNSIPIFGFFGHSLDAVLYQIKGEEPNRILIVQYQIDGPDYKAIQMKLFENGDENDIEVHLRSDIDGDIGGIIGIQNEDGTIGKTIYNEGFPTTNSRFRDNAFSFHAEVTDIVNGSFYKVLGEAPNRRLIIQWKDIYPTFYGATIENNNVISTQSDFSTTFQLKLFEDGKIESHIKNAPTPFQFRRYIGGQNSDFSKFSQVFSTTGSINQTAFDLVNQNYSRYLILIPVQNWNESTINLINSIPDVESIFGSKGFRFMICITQDTQEQPIPSNISTYLENFAIVHSLNSSSNIFVCNDFENRLTEQYQTETLDAAMICIDLSNMQIVYKTNALNVDLEYILDNLDKNRPHQIERATTSIISIDKDSGEINNRIDTDQYVDTAYFLLPLITTQEAGDISPMNLQISKQLIYEIDQNCNLYISGILTGSQTLENQNTLKLLDIEINTESESMRSLDFFLTKIKSGTSTNSKYIGMVLEEGETDSTVEVEILGTVIDCNLNLEPGVDYYLDNNNNITKESVNNRYIGVAIEPNKLLFNSGL